MIFECVQCNAQHLGGACPLCGSLDSEDGEIAAIKRDFLGSDMSLEDFETELDGALGLQPDRVAE